MAASAGSWQLEAGNWHLETENWKLATGNGGASPPAIRRHQADAAGGHGAAAQQKTRLHAGGVEGVRVNRDPGIGAKGVVDRHYVESARAAVMRCRARYSTAIAVTLRFFDRVTLSAAGRTLPRRGLAPPRTRSTSPCSPTMSISPCFVR